MRDKELIQQKGKPVVLKEELPEDVKAFLDDIGSRVSKKKNEPFLTFGLPMERYEAPGNGKFVRSRAKVYSSKVYTTVDG